MAKVLIFSDFHLHNWSYGATYQDGWNTRLLDQKKVADQIVHLAQHHRVDFVVFCGDLFHTHGRVESGPLQVASELFSSLHKEVKGRAGKVYCLKGNHDLGRETSSVDWLSNLGVNVVNDVTYDPELSLGFISYCDDEETFDNRRSILLKHDLEYWFTHQGVRFLPVGSDFVIPNEFLAPDKLPKTQKFNMCFTGHYHSHQWANDQIVVIGAPMQQNWSDKGDVRGCIILDTFTSTWTRYDLNAPRFVELDGALQSHIIMRPSLFSELSSDIPGKIEYEQIEGNFIRVTEEVPAVFMEEVRQKLKEAGARSVEFAFKPPTSRVGMAPTSFNINDLISRYEKLNKVDITGQEIGQQLRSGEFSCAS